MQRDNIRGLQELIKRQERDAGYLLLCAAVGVNFTPKSLRELRRRKADRTSTDNAEFFAAELAPEQSRPRLAAAHGRITLRQLPIEPDCHANGQLTDGFIRIPGAIRHNQALLMTVIHGDMIDTCKGHTDKSRCCCCFKHRPWQRGIGQHQYISALHARLFFNVIPGLRVVIRQLNIIR